MSAPHATPPAPVVRAYVRWVLRHGRALWVVALLFGVLATVRTVYLYAHLRSDVEELLPRDAPSVRALDEMRARSPGLKFLGVVVEVSDLSELPAAERLLDDLLLRIRAYPPEMVRDVRDSNAEEKAFVEKHAPLYLELADLKQILDRIEKRRDYEVAKESGTLIDDDAPPPPLDLSDIEKKYDSKTSNEKGGHLTNPDLKATMLTVEAGGFSTGADTDRVLLARVKADVAALDPSHYGKGLRVGYASDVAINVEEMDALESDLSVSSLLVIFAVIAVIVVYYRWWKSVPVLLPPLLLATVYAFAIASLPPMRINELNSNTAFLGSIIVGNGINVGLILLARYREARLYGMNVDDALVAGVWGARTGTLAAAAAAAVSYASLVFTEFRGFRQFGYIGGVGMIASWVTAFVLVPPLVKWLDRDGALEESHVRAHGQIMRGVIRLIERASPVLVGAAALLLVLSGIAISRFDASCLEHDFSKLRRSDTWQIGEGYWGRKMDAILGRYLTPTVILCDTREQALAVEKVVRESAEHGALEPMVARVIAADDVLPTQQADKLALVALIREALTPKIRTLVAEDKRDKLDRMLGEENARTVGVEDLPHTFMTGLRERDGTLGRTVLVYPRPSNALWKAEAIHFFVKTLRELAATRVHDERPGRVAGSIPLSGDILSSITRDAPIASLISFLGVVAVVLLVLRGRKASVYVIGALVVGVVWLGGAVMALGIKINFANFIAFPITFGIGVDYSVNVITRYVQDGEGDITGAVRSTGGAVALCSLTTIIGYSSLLLAKNNALFLFGLVAVTGELACLSAAVIALPAWLVFMQRRGGVRETRPRPQPGEPAHGE
jgi:predicted RND superfamily exporter protein